MILAPPQSLASNPRLRRWMDNSVRDGLDQGTSFLNYRVVQLNFTSISRVKSCWTSLYGFSFNDLTLYLFQVTCMVILLL